MNDKSQRWLVAAQAFQSLMMIAMVFAFLGVRMWAGALFDHYFEGLALPNLTQWMLNWGPTNPMSAWAFGVFCAATYMFLSLLAISRSESLVHALSKCYALASVWLVLMFYFLVMLLSFLFPFVPIISKLYGPDDPLPETHIQHSSTDPKIWLSLSVLYVIVLIFVTRKLIKRKAQEG
ncbi:hypothetical protein ACFLS1_10545 [Verrucomicrobiota bacterium]